MIFPRFHQLDVTRKLQAAVLADGPGGRYLVQHSAGSGKTNSIAWTAHFLAELHDAQDRKVFDTVLVVSDRNVIDGQLQDALFDFQRTSGVVATIKGTDGSKSAELTEALSGSKKIVVCTIQTFPFALSAVREAAATEGKRFAVIADEAHSSQAGEAAARLKEVLSADELAELGDGGEVSTEDILAAQMAARADDRGITFVAFTATPKTKTMELFGTRPDPTRKPAPDNVPSALPRLLHAPGDRGEVHPRRAAELHALQPGLQAGHGGPRGRRQGSRARRRAEADHGLGAAAPVQHRAEGADRRRALPRARGPAAGRRGQGDGRGRRAARKRSAGSWRSTRYIRDRGYPIGTLVAFSGEVDDPESGPDGFTEQSRSLNPNLKGRDIREAFEGDEYRILLVANKFQTGFDQPLLCGMYVDKRLAGIQAVQTLSRLNRAHPGKDTTYVLDFVNKPEDVLAAFKTYYTTAELAATTDPNLVFDLRAKLDAAGHYDDFEVDRVVAVVLDPRAKQGDLVAALAPVESRLMQRYKAAQAAHNAATGAGDEKAAAAARDEIAALLLFKSDMGAFVRLYTFLSQVFDYGNTAIEKRAIFYKRLLPLLEFGREREGIDLSKVVLTHHNLKDLGRRAMPLAEGETPKLEPITESGSGAVHEPQMAYMAELIRKLNDLFDGELTDKDKLVYVNHVIKGKLLESETLQQQAASNTKEQFGNSPDLNHELLNAIMGALDAHTAMSTQALNSEDVRRGLKDILLNHADLYETLRAQADAVGR